MSRRYKPKGTFQNRLAQVRQKKGWSRGKAAELVGLHWVTLFRHEHGIIRVSPSSAAKYAKAYGVRMSELFFDPSEKRESTKSQ